MQRVKHVQRRHFFVREMVEDGRIRVPFVGTVDNLADFFTKSLPRRPSLTKQSGPRDPLSLRAPAVASLRLAARPRAETGPVKLNNARGQGAPQSEPTACLGADVGRPSTTLVCTPSMLRESAQVASASVSVTPGMSVTPNQTTR